MESDFFLQLVRLGVGKNEVQGLKYKSQETVDWIGIESIAVNQGLLAVVYDAVQQLPKRQRPPQVTWLRWIGQVMLEEQEFAQQWQASCMMAQMFASSGIRTYVLKGMVVSECYPKPQHRMSADVDCFLTGNDKYNADDEYNVWEKGNRLIEEAGYKVGRGFYKNSTFSLRGVTVENHQYLVPFRGNETLKKLEKWLQGQIKYSSGVGGSRFEGTELWRPPVMVSALFLIEHAYSHFLHEGLTWRHVLDWVMYSRKHGKEIDWTDLEKLIDEFGFRRFYDSYTRMGQCLMGELELKGLELRDRLMLKDIWAPLDVQENLHSIKAKMGMARATIRARWKYRYFSPISMPQALWIQVKGVLFDKNPTI